MNACAPNLSWPKALFLSGIVAASLVLNAGCARPWAGESLYRTPWMPSWKRGDSNQVSFRIGQPGDDWEPYTGEGLQVAWADRALAAVIQVRGQCREHGDSTLEMFTQHISADFGAWETVPLDGQSAPADGSPPKGQPFSLVGRDALRTRVKARLDGVEVMLELVVVKKNGCLFDLTYIAPPRSFAEGYAAFGQVVEGFDYPVALTER